jgi:peptidoglycan L-alanyl-D-glutamate endopeptidase CwlK
MTEPPRLDSLDELRPRTKRKAERWLEAMAALAPLGVAPAVKIGETRRTPERQDWLFASGRTRPGPRVTDVTGASPRANHVAPPGQARAFDFWFVAPGTTPWSESHPWELAGVVGERLGLRWGGRWKSRDLGHLEDQDPAVGPSQAVVRRGARGEVVTRIQRALLDRGYLLGGHGATGTFGPQTELAIRLFEKTIGVQEDGEVDPVVAAALGVSLT